jgi:hypothetical protein
MPRFHGNMEWYDKWEVRVRTLSLPQFPKSFNDMIVTANWFFWDLGKIVRDCGIIEKLENGLLLTNILCDISKLRGLNWRSHENGWWLGGTDFNPQVENKRLLAFVDRRREIRWQSEESMGEVETWHDPESLMDCSSQKAGEWSERIAFHSDVLTWFLSANHHQYLGKKTQSCNGREGCPS